MATANNVSFSKLNEHADDKFFTAINKPAHCAHYLLPPIKPSIRSLRSLGHNYTRPKYNCSLYKNSCLPNCHHLYCKACAKS